MKIGTILKSRLMVAAFDPHELKTGDALSAADDTLDAVGLGTACFDLIRFGRACAVTELLSLSATVQSLVRPGA